MLDCLVEVVEIPIINSQPVRALVGYALGQVDNLDSLSISAGMDNEVERVAQAHGAYSYNYLFCRCPSFSSKPLSASKALAIKPQPPSIPTIPDAIKIGALDSTALNKIDATLIPIKKPPNADLTTIFAMLLPLLHPR